MIVRSPQIVLAGRRGTFWATEDMDFACCHEPIEAWSTGWQRGDRAWLCIADQQPDHEDYVCSQAALHPPWIIGRMLRSLGVLGSRRTIYWWMEIDDEEIIARVKSRKLRA